jgi:hypothetical protein
LLQRFDPAFAFRQSLNQLLNDFAIRLLGLNGSREREARHAAPEY